MGRKNHAKRRRAAARHKSVVSSVPNEPKPSQSSQIQADDQSSGLADEPAVPPGIYSPLRPGQIRLIEVQHHKSGKITCNLQAVDLDSAPPYFALSYVCGNGPNEVKIAVNGHLLEIKRRLLTALRKIADHLRARQLSKALIWVDAISINQNDLEEKAEQVYEMHRVFSGAQEVLAWLGRIPPTVHLVLHVFRWAASFMSVHDQLPQGWRMSNVDQFDNVHGSLWDHGPERLSIRQQAMVYGLASQARSLGNKYRITYSEIIALAVLLRYLRNHDYASGSSHMALMVEQALDVNPTLEYSLPRPHHTFLSGLCALLEVEWFSRVWTYQEIKLARKATVLTNGIHVDWNMVRWANFDILNAYLQEGLRDRLRYIRSPPSRSEEIAVARFAGCLIRWFQFTVKASDPSKYLQFLGDRKATLSKDHVYGSLGLWPDEIRKHVQVDYNTSDADVFAAAVKVCLRHHPDLAIRTFWSREYDSRRILCPIQNLPSWCPDLRVSLVRLGTFHWLHHNVREKYSPRACYEDTPHLKMIAINVMCLDRVERFTVAPCPDMQGTLHFEPSWLDDQRYASIIMTWIIEMCNTLYPHNSDALDAFLEISQDDVNSFLAVSPSEPKLHSRHDLVDPIWGIHNKVAGNFLFQTASGRIGYSARPPIQGASIVLVPGCFELQMLSPDATHYIGCASVLGLEGETLLDPPADLENKWEMVYLT